MIAEWEDPSAGPPKISVPREARFPYISWFLYDIDAPHPYDRRDTPVLHFARVNIPCTKKAAHTLSTTAMSDRASLVNYLAPVAAGGIPHCYQILVVGHTDVVNVPLEMQRLLTAGRVRWDYKALISRYGMMQLYQKNFLNVGGASVSDH